MSSNGMLYFKPEVQSFLDKYQQFISLNITVDGPKEVHDVCRVDFDGNGSFDRAIAAWDDWLIRTKGNSIATKITIAPENLPYLENIFDFFIGRGCKQINANPIFEHEWTPEEAKMYYKILIKLADRLLDEPNVKSSLFKEYIGKPLPDSDINNYCGGTSAMLAFDPQGNAYPCLRYMASSLGPNVPPLIIGNTEGIYQTAEAKAIYDDMQKVTRQSQST
jgi:sulfatase maturation enzyme AslB (radical SAM superfamily)